MIVALALMIAGRGGATTPPPLRSPARPSQSPPAANFRCQHVAVWSGGAGAWAEGSTSRSEAAEQLVVEGVGAVLKVDSSESAPRVLTVKPGVRLRIDPSGELCLGARCHAIYLSSSPPPSTGAALLSSRVAGPPRDSLAVDAPRRDQMPPPLKSSRRADLGRPAAPARDNRLEVPAGLLNFSILRPAANDAPSVYENPSHDSMLWSVSWSCGALLACFVAGFVQLEVSRRRHRQLMSGSGSHSQMLMRAMLVLPLLLQLANGRAPLPIPRPSPARAHANLCFAETTTLPSPSLPPPSFPRCTDVALTANTTASSFVSSNVAANAIDGNGGTRWESAAADPQWLRLDLGNAYLLCEVQITLGGCVCQRLRTPNVRRRLELEHGDECDREWCGARLFYASIWRYNTLLEDI